MKALLTGMEWLPDEPGAGGLARYFHGLVQALPARGVSGTALVSRLKSRPALIREGASAFDVLPMAAQGASLLRRWRGASGFLHQNPDIDVVNVHFALHAFWLVRRLPREMPLVVHFHGPWADEVAAENGKRTRRLRSIIARRIELAVYGRATRLITLSHAFARILRTQYGIPAERICVVPGGVDLERYLAAPTRMAARDRLGWPKDRPILLAVRRLVRRVGLELLIDAMGQIRRVCPDVLLLIGGRGPLAAELQQCIERAGLTSHVRLLGLIPEDDLPAAYAAADLSIVPSMKLEGFGLATVESLGCGTPVLGTPVGGTPEILRELEPALVLEAVTADAIANRAAAVLRQTLPLPSADRCRAYSTRYDWKQVAPRIKHIYEQAIEEQRPCSVESLLPEGG